MSNKSASTIHLHTDEPEPPPSKKGCLGLMLGAVIFIFAILGGLIYLFTRGPSPEVQANEQRTIQACEQRASAPDTSEAERFSIGESCREMRKQYVKKYGKEPGV
ncbi:hypothetical protein IQ22_03242 [Pseudomonas duriflava]|uniref:Uncharacterized protein n=1 Tax=Pseudomonas duriflava TaxID=459528 RepID=A0A562Q6W8_9PSED|nr:hypothetical protein [Pseudomonas duriflava]TWI52473.1 hypothetical protein IQ22_03242 [Pseudomonas duriflava]